MKANVQSILFVFLFCLGPVKNRDLLATVFFLLSLQKILYTKKLQWFGFVYVHIYLFFLKLVKYFRKKGQSSHQQAMVTALWGHQKNLLWEPLTRWPQRPVFGTEI